MGEAENGQAQVTVESPKERTPYGTANAQKKYTERKISSIVARVHWHLNDSVDAVKKQVEEMPAAAKSKLARSPEFVEYLEAFAIDVLLGVKKPTKEEWAAHQFLAKHLSLQGRVNRKKGVDGKNAGAMMDADVVVEAEGSDAP